MEGVFTKLIYKRAEFKSPGQKLTGGQKVCAAAVAGAL